jgi:hypothetical protein
MKLFLVRYEEQWNGLFNMDLLVIAESVEQAIKLWRGWVAAWIEADGLDPFWVRELSFAKVEGPARAIEWEDTDLPMVFDKPGSY